MSPSRNARYGRQHRLPKTQPPSGSQDSKGMQQPVPDDVLDKIIAEALFKKGIGPGYLPPSQEADPAATTPE